MFAKLITNWRYYFLIQNYFKLVVEELAFSDYSSTFELVFQLEGISTKILSLMKDNMWQKIEEEYLDFSKTISDRYE